MRVRKGRLGGWVPCWAWPSLLGLDAPIVAVIWQDFLARCYPSTLLPMGRCTLFLTVWAIYLADRLLDVRTPKYSSEPVPHSFCRKYRGRAGALLAMVLLADFVAGFRWVRPAVFANGMVVSAGVVAYFGAFPLARFRTAWKPGAVAILFTTGVFLVAATVSPKPEHTLIVPAISFCLLCLSNLLLIRGWEIRRDGRAGIFAAASAAVFGCFAAPAWLAAIALSSVGLMTLDLLRTRIPPTARRVLADAVLLSPVLCLWMLIG